MQARLNAKHDKILAERDQWEKDKELMASLVKLDSEVVALNVGGTHHMMTERDVLRLCPGSILERMFNGLHELKKIEGEVFLDRDGKTFQYLVNYLRNDREVFPEFMDRNDEIHFFKELDFWKVPVKPTSKHHPNTLRRNQQIQQQTTTTVVHHPPPQQQQKPIPTPSQIYDDYVEASAEDSHGVALKAAKDKWNELGPLRLEDIVSNSKEPID